MVGYFYFSHEEMMTEKMFGDECGILYLTRNYHETQ